MLPNKQFSHSGGADGGFRLGSGAEATGGDIKIELSCCPSTTPEVFIEWRASPDSVPDEARKEIVSFIDSFLRNYLERNPIGAFYVIVVDAGWDTKRRNEPVRATWIALHYAIKDAKLPPALLYAAPEA